MIQPQAYIVGARIGQALILSDPEACFNPRRRTLCATLSALKAAIVELCKHLRFNDRTQAAWLDQLDRCYGLAINLSGFAYEDDLINDLPKYERCLEDVHILKDSIASMLSARLPVANLSFELGLLIVRGEFPDNWRPPTNPNLTPASNAPQTDYRQDLLDAEQAWILSKPETVANLIEQLQVAKSDLMPTVKDTDNRDLFDEIPNCVSAGWRSIERGFSTVGVAIAWDTRTEERNRWIYEQLCEVDIPIKIVKVRLREIIEKGRDWDLISTETGLVKAAEKYADAHGLRLLPSRPVGRKRNSN